MPTLKTFSTDEVPPRQALSYWNDWVSETFTQLSVRPGDAGHFKANLIVTDLGYLRFANPASGPSVVSHSKYNISKSQEEVFLLHLQANGNSLNQQEGKNAILNNGDYTLCDSSRPYELSFESSNSMLVLVIPKCELRNRLANPEAYTCIQMPGDKGVSNIVSRFIQSVWEQCLNNCTFEIENQLADNILDLLVTSYASVKPALIEESSVITTRRIMLREFIERNLHNQELSVATITAEMGYSTSYLHQLFKGEGESISRYIMRRRLEEAGKALRYDPQRRLTISDVAFKVGFKNTTHFGRLFKKHYGMTPSEYRERP